MWWLRVRLEASQYSPSEVQPSSVAQRPYDG